MTNPSNLYKRHKKAALLEYSALGAILFSVTFLLFFLADMILKGYPAFEQTKVKVEFTYSKESQADPAWALSEEDYNTLIENKILTEFWEVDFINRFKADPNLIGSKEIMWILAESKVDQYVKGHHSTLPDDVKPIVDKLVQNGQIELHFNTEFFGNGDSKTPENAGLYSALIGTVLTLIVTMSFALPIGVMSAIYLEEFAPKNRFIDFIDININNLAAIPSILFGLLGLAIFISLFGIPRSSALVGGMTLGLMTLPVIIVSSKAALKSVPASIRHAGLGVGLTKWQVIKDHVLPVASPGILTGAIIGLAQAIGETAPLIMVGMIAFIPDAPSTITQAATVLPAQIFTWAGMPEGGYIEKTAAGILVLLGVMITMNGIAIYLRNKFQTRW